ncbi:MAG TPA: biotin/lipoyl-containing protein [Patescibacteria group bacterium]|nr:biotin/lipoyl-containing protein [Patescibacteria group bacterium]
MVQRDGEMTERTPEERLADHATIDRLADELLPALVAKLGASGLGEMDVREGGWRIRLRMPADGRASRRSSGPGRGGHQSPSGPANPAAHAAPTARGASPAPNPGDFDDPAPASRAVATAPAVGFYRPRPGLAAGARVRAGDRLGTIDVLGVPQEVVAPSDGIVGATHVEPGDPVEYGQEIVEIELLGAPTVTPGAPPASTATPTVAPTAAPPAPAAPTASTAAPTGPEAG